MVGAVGWVARPDQGGSHEPRRAGGDMDDVAATIVKDTEVSGIVSCDVHSTANLLEEAATPEAERADCVNE